MTKPHQQHSRQTSREEARKVELKPSVSDDVGWSYRILVQLDHISTWPRRVLLEGD